MNLALPYVANDCATLVKFSYPAQVKATAWLQGGGSLDGVFSEKLDRTRPWSLF